ncbi:MAG: hypothetical protein KDC92_10880, partial [Bacteroidetes bacterium]|nr:hypothetical protein [Bacteroidota bacterium]
LSEAQLNRLQFGKANEANNEKQSPFAQQWLLKNGHQPDKIDWLPTLKGDHNHFIKLQDLLVELESIKAQPYASWYLAQIVLKNRGFDVEYAGQDEFYRENIK